MTTADRSVRLMATGGTIASRRNGSRHVATVGGAELLASAVVPAGSGVDVVDAGSVGSFAWCWTELAALCRHLGDALADGVDGVVVTHGTDTMEEVAFLVSLLHDDVRPVVFTGAQRPFDDPAPDGPANLADALTTAAHPAARNRGVLVGFDGEVYGARGVTKVETTRSGAFAAPGRGPMMRVVRGELQPLSPPARPPALSAALDEAAPPRVDVVPMYAGVDDLPLRAAVSAGARGIVLAAFGVGNANPAVVAAVRDAVAAGIPVLVCSRTWSGPVAPVYGGGGGADLADAGAVLGDDLSPWQGRMLLSVALVAAPEAATSLVQSWLSSTGGHA